MFVALIVLGYIFLKPMLSALIITIFIYNYIYIFIEIICLKIRSKIYDFSFSRV